MMEAGSRVTLRPCSRRGGGGGEESMKVFKEGIDLAINFCSVVQFNVICGYLGSQPHLRIQNLCDTIFSCFIQSKDQIPPTNIALKELLRSFLRVPRYHLDSIEEVSDDLLAMYQECLRGDFTSIQIFKEANARRQMWKQVTNFQIQTNHVMEKIHKDDQALYDIQDSSARKLLAAKQAKRTLLHHVRRMRENQQRLAVAEKSSTYPTQTIQEEKAVSKFGTITSSLELIKELNMSCPLMQKQANNPSKMDGSTVLQGDLMRVFKEGVSLFMDDLWHHLIIEKKCGSIPTPMLQYLSDVILFWFTQTIKPLSLDHIKRILKNEMYCLPFLVIHCDILREVVKKLMVMYEECLQGDFSSVDIIREESLSRASSMMKLQ